MILPTGSGGIEYSQKHTNDTNLSGYQTNQARALSDFGFRMHRSRVFDSGMGGIIYIAAGMNYNPTDADNKAFLDNQYMEAPNYCNVVYEKWLEHRAEVMAHIDTLPTHREFLAQHIHK
jgi:hypothetical protein